MPFSVTWHTLLEEAEDLPEGATLITPLSHKRFRITDTQYSCPICANVVEIVD